jgi:hypothetical protein
MHHTEHNDEQTYLLPMIIMNFPCLCLFLQKDLAAFNTFMQPRWQEAQETVYRCHGINSISLLDRSLADLESSYRFNLCLVVRRMNNNTICSKQMHQSHSITKTSQKVILRSNFISHKYVKDLEENYIRLCNRYEWLLFIKTCYNIA